MDEAQERWALRGIVLLGVLLVGFALFMSLFAAAGRRAERNVKPLPARFADGSYQGSFDSFGVTLAAVRFEVSGGKVTSVSFPTLVATPGWDAAETIRERAVSEPSLVVDGISGASITVSFARAAIAEALNQEAKSQ